MRLPPLYQDEIARRLPVWEAFATLFLDVDPEVFRPYVVRAMLDSPYSREELWEMLEQEVAPVFIGNLSLVAGDWIEYPAAHVRRVVLRRIKLVRWGLAGWRRFHDEYVDGQWHWLCVGMERAGGRVSK